MTEISQSDQKDNSINVRTESHLETEDNQNPSNHSESLNNKMLGQKNESSDQEQLPVDIDKNIIKKHPAPSSEEKDPEKNKPTKINEASTIATSTVILNKSDIMGENDPYNNLNLPKMENKKMSAIELGQQGNNNNAARLGFFGKTKQWAGNVWRSMTSINLGQMWAKQEFEECYDSSGNKIKVPKKKIPLKKPPKKPVDPDEKKAIYQIKEEQQNYEVRSFESFPYGGFFI